MPLETRPGSTHLINETRHGSDGAGIEVYDPTTGNPLKFEYLPGTEMMARNIPGVRNQRFVHHVWTLNGNNHNTKTATVPNSICILNRAASHKRRYRSWCGVSF